MKQGFEGKLGNAVQRCKNQGVGGEVLDHIPTYVKTMDRMGAKSSKTKRLYVDDLRKLFLQHDELTPGKIKELDDEELRDLNEEVVDNIQKSVYKVGDGDLAVRSKNHLWKTWKYLLDSLRIPTEKTEPHIPATNFSTDKSRKDVQAGTKPSDLPTPTDMREFLDAVESVSEPVVADRNVALFGLLWSTGPRINEALNITMDQVSVQKKRPRIKMPGNKGAKDRSNIPAQCWKTITEYVEEHPKPNDPDAYLFYPKKHGSCYDKLNRVPIKRKLDQAKEDRGLDFKTYGEPFHIFRKAFTTFLIVNEIATWEEVCTMQGKKPDATKPDYLKISETDVNESYLEGLGVDVDQQSDGHRMRGEALKPLKCPGCGRLNRCYRGSCQSCSQTLRPEDLANIEDEENTVDMGRVRELENQLDKLLQDS